MDKRWCEQSSEVKDAGAYLIERIEAKQDVSYTYYRNLRKVLLFDELNALESYVALRFFCGCVKGVEGMTQSEMNTIIEKSFEEGGKNYVNKNLNN